MEQIMSFLKNLFKTNEVKQVLLVFKTLPEKGIELDKDIAEALRNIIIDTPQQVHQAMSKENTAEDVLYNVLFRLTDNYLCSGQYHIYRGVLGIGGAELKKQNDICVQRLIKLGYWSEEDARTYKIELEQNIADVG